jgi:hypothetical protein
MVGTMNAFLRGYYENKSGRSKNVNGHCLVRANVQFGTKRGVGKFMLFVMRRAARDRSRIDIVSAVIAFALSAGLLNAGQQSAAPTPRPRPTPHLRPTPYPRPTASATPSATPTATPSATPTASPSGTPIVTPTPTPTPPDNTFLTDLYAYYKLDETNGNATDASGNGKTLSNFGNFIGTAPGIINSARDFDGVAGTTLIRDANTTDFFCGANPFSFSFWVRFDTLPVTVDIGLCNRYEPDGRREYIVFLKQGTNKIAFSIDAGDGVHRAAIAWGIAATTGRWYFVAGGWDGTHIKLSINGGLFVTAPYSTPMTNGGDNFKLGYEADSLDGSMDEFGFWIGRCLTQAEARQLYNNGAGLPFSSFH